MSDFTFETTPRVICEFDGALQLGSLCNEFGAKRAILITDPGLQKAGLIDAPIRPLLMTGSILFCGHVLKPTRLKAPSLMP